MKRFISFQSEVNSRITIIEGKYFNFCEINGSRDDDNDQDNDDNDEGHKIVILILRTNNHDNVDDDKS